MFCRAALAVLVNNMDEHMRHYGMLHDGTSWRHSPSCVVNPYLHRNSNTPLTPEDDPEDRDVRSLVKEADSFRLRQNEAMLRIQSLVRAVSH
ncbi:hypothetical protein CGQ24_10605 [Arthrobacter sp. 7749]|nr:hypothetical protein CGQ24_10605 [Arthrobacter sp. 7749]